MINLEGKEILVVEDEDMNFIYLKQIFKLTKGNYIRVKTGRDAIKECSQKAFDLILMDIHLPDMPGTDATREIRKTKPEVTIIAQTASRSPSEIDEILDSGCDDVLVKPFKLEDFSEKLSIYF